MQAAAQTDHTFRSRDVALHARLYTPEGRPPFHTLLYVHGGGDYSLLSDPYAQNTVRAFNENGMAVLVFDKRGLGQSGGEYELSNLAGKTEDVRQALDYLRTLEDVDQSCTMVWAISQAGWFAPQAIEGREDVCGLILVSPAGTNPFEHARIWLRVPLSRAGVTGAALDEATELFSMLLRYQGTGENYEAMRAAMARAEQQAWFAAAIATETWQGLPNSASALLAPDALRQAWAASPADYDWFREEAHTLDFTPVYESVRQPVLLIYGDADTLIDPAQSRAIFERVWAGREDVTVTTYEGAGHGIQTRADGAENPTPAYLAQITDWAAARFGISP